MAAAARPGLAVRAYVGTRSPAGRPTRCPVPVPSPQPGIPDPESTPSAAPVAFHHVRGFKLEGFWSVRASGSQLNEVLSYGFGLFKYVNVRSRVAMVGLLRISCSIVHDVSDVN